MKIVIISVLGLNDDSNLLSSNGPFNSLPEEEAFNGLSSAFAAYKLTLNSLPYDKIF